MLMEFVGQPLTLAQTSPPPYKALALNPAPCFCWVGSQLWRDARRGWDRRDGEGSEHASGSCLDQELLMCSFSPAWCGPGEEAAEPLSYM